MKWPLCSLQLFCHVRLSQTGHTDIFHATWTEEGPCTALCASVQQEGNILKAHRSTAPQRARRQAKRVGHILARDATFNKINTNQIIYVNVLLKRMLKDLSETR